MGIKCELRDLIRDVLKGDVATGRGAIAGQLFNALLRAIEVERKVREQDEMLERISELETQIAQAAHDREEGQGGGYGGGRW